jgi:hypothetical protein
VPLALANKEKRAPGQIYGINYGEDIQLPLTAAWQSKKFAAGFSGILIPKEYIRGVASMEKGSK